MAVVRALVKPELLVWARESSRLGVEEAAKKVPVKPARLEEWESGDKRPTIKQLRKLGRIYKRPLAVFYLSKPPKKFQAMQDFRRLPSEVVGQQSPALAFEVRRALSRREIALDLYRDLVGKPPAFQAQAKVSEDAEDVAVRLRKLLGVSYEEQTAWKTPYDALNRWRSALEAAGVLVFQARGVEVDEMRGFSFSENPFPIIVVNLKDVPQARVFSMLHEAAHLALREGGVCDLLGDERSSSKQQRIEAFCNRVAGAALVPRDRLLGEEEVRTQRGPDWPDDTIAVLAGRYRASREVILRRMLDLGKTTQGFYKKKRRELRDEFEARGAAPKDKKVIVTPDRIAVSTAGPFYVRLVLNSYNQERITSNDLASFLDVRLKHLPKIEQAVLRRAAGS